MSDYSDCYYELHEDEIKRERVVRQYRERLVSELSTNAMIRIMFSNFINVTGASDVIRLGEKYLDK